MPELEVELNDEYNIYKTRQISHVHLKTPVTGVALTDVWSKIPLDTTNFVIKAFGGFTFDDANDRFYWDQSGVINKSLPATFIGDAGLIVTAGISSVVTITMGLFIDGVLILETPMDFTVLNSIGSYGANGILVDASDADLLQSGQSDDLIRLRCIWRCLRHMMDKIS